MPPAQIEIQSITFKVIDGARAALTEHFVPKCLGFSYKTKNKFVPKYTRPFAQHLLPSPMMVSESDC